MVSMYSRDGRLLAQNPAALACYGRAVSASSNLSLTDRLHEPTVAKHVLARVDEDEEFAWEARVTTLRGERTHRISAQRGRDPVTGSFVAILSEEDITEVSALRRSIQTTNKNLEAEITERSKALLLSEERYKLAVETAAMWDWDIVEDKLFLSPSFVRDLGYDELEFRERLISKSFFDFILAEDLPGYLKVREQHLSEPDRPLSHELRFITKSGTARWYQLRGKCVCNAEGAPVRSVGLITDISKRKELEASLFASQRLEAVGQLTGGIAHDFNNLLTVIQGNAEFLGDLGDTNRELAGEILAAVDRGAELTRHLLAFARKQTLAPRPVDLSDLIEKMRKTLLRTLSENIEIVTSQSGNLWNVYADASQVEAAILNLALNSRDAMPRGGRLTIECRNKKIDAVNASDALDLSFGDYVEILIADTGCGMSESTLSKAFEPFFTTKEVGSGSGLGLSMVLGFSRQSGGDVKVESAVGQGTTISMYLPRSMSSLPDASASKHKTKTPGAGEHVHVLEDDPTVQRTISKVLESLGYVVSLSTNVETALRAVTSEPIPDVVIADVILPGRQNGVDFAKALRKLHPDAKLILMSGYPKSEVVAGSLRYSSETFLLKPFDRASIATAVEAALKGHALEQAE